MPKSPKMNTSAKAIEGALARLSQTRDRAGLPAKDSIVGVTMPALRAAVLSTPSFIPTRWTSTGRTRRRQT